jgi:hypothetical protein
VGTRTLKAPFPELETDFGHPPFAENAKGGASSVITAAKVGQPLRIRKQTRPLVTQVLDALPVLEITYPPLAIAQSRFENRALGPTLRRHSRGHVGSESGPLPVDLGAKLFEI